MSALRLIVVGLLTLVAMLALAVAAKYTSSVVVTGQVVVGLLILVAMLALAVAGMVLTRIR